VRAGWLQRSQQDCDGREKQTDASTSRPLQSCWKPLTCCKSTTARCGGWKRAWSCTASNFGSKRRKPKLHCKKHAPAGRELASQQRLRADLAEIVEAQHQIQIGNLESDQAMAMVAERIARITNASGAAIGILEGKTIRYRAGAGAPACPWEARFPWRPLFVQSA
jgi:hypothetical protein